MTHDPEIERIARIVDEAAWKERERLLSLTFQGKPAPGYDAANTVIKPSLVKARAIIAGRPGAWPPSREAIAREIYDANPACDQEVDCDYRPMGAPYTVPWDKLNEYATDIFDDLLSTAERILALAPSPLPPVAQSGEGGSRFANVSLDGLYDAYELLKDLSIKSRDVTHSGEAGRAACAVANAHHAIHRALSASPSPPKQGEGWRKISDELPPEAHIVLLTAWREDPGDWLTNTGYLCRDPGPQHPLPEDMTRWTWSGRNVHTYDIQPTHWQPLPSPPAGEKT